MRDHLACIHGIIVREKTKKKRKDGNDDEDDEVE
jgi:hypothetical protein